MAAQTTCKSECAAMKEEASTEAKATHAAKMERHMATIKETLNKEQYAKWQTWCAGRTVKNNEAGVRSAGCVDRSSAGVLEEQVSAPQQDESSIRKVW